MGSEIIEQRITTIEKKLEELEKGLFGIIQNMQRNAEIMGTIHETFQNLNAYLVVNVGPPLFVD